MPPRLVFSSPTYKHEVPNRSVVTLTPDARKGRYGIVTSSPDNPNGGRMFIPDARIEVHPNAIKKHSQFIRQDKVCLVIEKCNNGKSVLIETISVKNKRAILDMALELKILNPGKYLLHVDGDIHYLYDIKPSLKTVYKK